MSTETVHLPLVNQGTESQERIRSSDLRREAQFAELGSLPSQRKTFVLVMLCTALFLDTYNNSSLLTSLPILSSEIHITDAESVWLFGGYQLTFASLLLVCGRISDLYNPKWVFLVGSTSLSIFALIAGFMRKEIPHILFRAFMGAGAALTIPSSQHLIVHMYPEPEEQAKALAVFAGMAGFGLMFGLFLGSIFVQFASWPWVYHFGAILSGSISIGIFVLVPNIRRTRIAETRLEKIMRLKRLDIFGVSLLTAALILFIFALTSGSSTGWGSAQVIAPIILSVFLAIGFFVYEAYIPEDDAALPPKIWRYENVAILIASCFVPFMWWGSIYPLFSWYWEVVENWSPMKIAVHFLPITLGMVPMVPLAPVALKKIPAKWLILFGFVLNITGNILLPFNSSPSRYWRFGFPGFFFGTAGAALIYSAINITLLAITPPEISGVISAVFIAVGQTGSAAGLSIVTSIQTNVEKDHGGPFQFDGRAAGLWFLMATSAVFGILFLIFMKNTGPQTVTVTKIRPEENYAFESQLSMLSRVDTDAMNDDRGWEPRQL